MKGTFKRIFFGILLLFILLLGAIYGILRVPYVQNLVVNHVTSFISEKTKSEFSIGYIYLSFPKSLVIEDISLKSPNGDNFLKSEEIEVDIDFETFSLETIILDKVGVKGLDTSIEVNSKGEFNFDYLINAFASDSEEEVVEVDTTSTPTPLIVIHEIDIQSTKFSYIDSVLQLKTDVNIGSFFTSIPEINVDKGEYKVNDFILNNSTVDYTQFGVMPTDTTSSNTTEESTPFLLKLSHAKVNNFTFTYNEKVLNENSVVKVGNLELKDHSFDLEKSDIYINEVALNNSFISYDVTSDTTKVVEYHKPLLKRSTTLDIGWNVVVNNSTINALDVKYNDHLYDPLEKGLDPNHIFFRKISTSVSEISVSDDRISLDVLKFKLKEKSGFVINNFSSLVEIKPRELSVKKLLFEFNNSFIHNDLYLQYPDLYTIGDYPEELYFRNTLHKAHFNFSDFTIFEPSLQTDTLIAPFLQYDLDLATTVEGQVNDIKINKTEIATSLGIKTGFQLDLKNAMVEDSLSFAMSVDSLKFYTSPLLEMFLDSTMKASYEIPTNISGDLVAEGDLKDIRSSARINLNGFGGFDYNLRLVDQNRYDFNTNTYNLDVGRILKDSTVGKISTDLHLKGKGTDVENDLLAQLDFNLQKAEYNNFDYGGLSVSMDIDRMSANWKANTSKEAFNLSLTGAVNMNEELPTASIEGVIHNMDLKEMNFYEDTLSFGMSIKSETKGFDLYDLNSTLDLDDIFFIQDKERHDVKFLRSHIELDSNHVLADIETEAIKSHIYSDVALDSISIIMERYFSQYLSSREMIGKLPPSKGKLDGFVEIKDSKFITNGTVTGLDSLRFEKCDFNFDAATNKFDFDLLVPKVTYTDYNIDTIYANIHADGKKIIYDLGFSQFVMKGYEEYALHNWSLKGDAADNGLNVYTEGYHVNDNEKWLFIGGHLNLDSTTYKFTFDEELIVNSERWNIDKENYILSDGGLPYINHLFIQKGSQSIKFETTQYDNIDTLYAVEINQFSLDSTTLNVETDTSLINGEINALVKVGDVYEGGALSADLNVKGFGFLNTILADISSKASNTDNINIYKNTTSMKGLIGDISMKSTYNMADSIAPLDLLLEFKEFNFEPFSVFGEGYISKLSGGVDGKIAVKGLGEAPLDVDGLVNLNSPKFNIDPLNVYLVGTQGTIIFDNKGIHFNNCGFKDEKDRLASLKGEIKTTNYTDFDFDLKFLADDITLINSTSKENPEYFGKLIIGNVTKITGPLDHLLIESDIRIVRGTDLTYVYMDGGVGDIDTGEDIVNFIDKSDTTIVNSKADNYEIKAKIYIDEKSIFKVVIDPRAGDALTLVGGGTLHLRMDAGDDLVMSGQYRITEGEYSMTFYQLMNKKLRLQKGSSVLWTGDPYNPQADMTAVYTASTAPYPLVANILETPNEINKYKSKRKFIVYMNMSGDVIKPELSFKLEYPDGGGDKVETAVDNLNQDESQLNKQVFSFLVLGTFLNDAGGGGTSTSDMVAGSVSSIISQQLNNVTENLTGGFVDVNFDVDSYSQVEGTNRTDVGVTLKKTLFNERLSVSVGGKVAVSGNETGNNNSSNFNTDFLLEYNLLTDGTVKNTLFRQIDPQYFTPDVFKTGVSIVFTKEYNQGKELFIRNLDKKKDIRKRMGMIKRSNTGGGMMQSASDSSNSSGMMQPASGGMMMPASQTKDTTNTDIDTSAVSLDSVQIDSTNIQQPIDTLNVEQKSSPLGQTPVPTKSVFDMDLFLLSNKNEKYLTYYTQDDE